MTEPIEPCAAEENGMERCNRDHHVRGVACGDCAPATPPVAFLGLLYQSMAERPDLFGSGS